MESINVSKNIPLHGVSVRHLKSITSSFSREMKVREVVNAIFIPATIEKHCSYAETLIEATSEYVKDRAEVFVSYCWDYPWRVLMEAITPQENDQDCFVWLDCVVLPQHNIGNNFAPDWWFGAFESALRRIGKVIFVIHPWFAPEYFTRSWCLFEALQASESGVEVLLKMPKLDQFTLKHFMRAGKADLNFFIEIFSNVNIEKAQAEKVEDQAKILSMLRKHGIELVTSALIEPFKRWLLDIGTELEWEAKQDLLQDQQVLSTLTSCAELRSYLNDYDGALKLFHEDILPYFEAQRRPMLNEEEAVWIKYEEICNHSKLPANARRKQKFRLPKVEKKVLRQTIEDKRQWRKNAEEQAIKQADEKLLLDFLLSVPKLRSLEGSQFDEIMNNGCNNLFFKDGEVIFFENDTYQDMIYSVRSGIVRLVRGASTKRGAGNIASLENFKEIVDELRSTDCFGDNLNDNYTMSVTAVAIGIVWLCVFPNRNYLKKQKKEQMIDENNDITDISFSSLASHARDYEIALRSKMDARTTFEAKITQSRLAILRSFSPELSSNDCMERVIMLMYEIFGVERISLFYVDWSSEQLLLQVRTQTDLQEIRIPVGTGLVGSCARSGSLINIPDVSKDPRFFGDMDKKSGFKTRCVLNFPVLEEETGRAIAVVQLVNKKPNDIFSEEDERIIIAISKIFSPIIKIKVDEIFLKEEEANFVPIYRIQDHFRICLNQCVLDRPLNSTVLIETSIYHGGIEISQKQTTLFDLNSKQPVGIDLGIQCLNIPRASRLILNVWYPSQTADGKPVLNSSGSPQKGDAIGWTGTTLFTFEKILKSGLIKLSLFPGNCSPLSSAVMLSSNANGELNDRCLELEFTPLCSKSIKLVENPHPLKTNIEDQNNDEPSEDDQNILTYIREMSMKDPLFRVSADQKSAICRYRRFLTKSPQLLPLVLQCLKWNSVQDVRETFRLLYEWAPLTPSQFLILLDWRTPDPSIRALAVSQLEKLTDEELLSELLQVVQAIKIEPFIDCALSRFLLRRALHSPQTVGRAFFWHLTSESYNPDSRVRFEMMRKIYIRHCGEMYRERLGQEEYVVHKMHSLHSLVTSSRHSLSRYLKNMKFPTRFQLPIHSEIELIGIVSKKSRTLKTTKKPLLLEFVSAQPFQPALTVLVKKGDDLRQDQMILQLLSFMDKLWKAEGLDLEMSCYGCFSTGLQTGLIEIMLEADTLRRIVFGRFEYFKLTRAMATVYDERVLKRWLENQKDSQEGIFRENFLRSCAGYAVSTYVLGIGDRHSDKLMLTKTGKLFHIDFSHILGENMANNAPFYFTPSMAYVLGGTSSEQFKAFENICCRAFNILRKNSYVLIMLFALSLQCGVPQLKTENDIAYFRERLLIDQGTTDEDASKHFIKQIHKAIRTRTTQLRDALFVLDSKRS